MLSISLPVKRDFSFKTWGVWSIFCFIFASTSVPFLITLQGDLLTENLSDLPFSPAVAMTISAAVNAVISVVLAGIGLWMATRIGLGLPFIEKAFDDKPIWNKAIRFTAIGIVIGVLATALTIFVDSVIFSQPMTNILEPPEVDLRGLRPPFWQGFLAAFSAGVLEETIFRLFGLTLLMWVGHWFSKTESGRPTVIVFIIANIIIAVVFGLSHIANLSLFDVEPTAAVIVRILALNSGMALLFGWTYWRFGLEVATIAHIIVDILLQGVGSFASHATTGFGAFVVYAVAHVILFGIAALLWYMATEHIKES